MSVWRTASRRAKHGSSPLSLRSQSRNRKRRATSPWKARHIGDGWVSPPTVLSIHALAPFPQLNNCIHIHPSVLSVRSRGLQRYPLPSPSPLPPVPPSLAFLRLSVVHCTPVRFSRRPYRSVGNVQRTRHRKILPRSNLRSNCTLKAHHVAERETEREGSRASVRASERELQNGGYVMSDQK